MYINVPVTNLYLKPDNTSEVVSQGIYGWPLKLLDKHAGYVKVETFDKYQGWAETAHLIDRSFSPSKKIAKIIHNAAHLYAVPDTTKRRPLMTLPFEVTLNILDEPSEDNNRWIKIKLLDSTEAWIQRGDVSIDPSFLMLTEMLNLSTQFLGLPYTWGGVSSFGYDCSGYVQMLFRQIGIVLPRDAKDQKRFDNCRPIDLENVQGGDLLFFGPSGEKITHVGLCLDSKRMIHATVKPVPVLQITDLDDKGLAERLNYRAAARVQTIEDREEDKKNNES